MSTQREGNGVPRVVPVDSSRPPLGQKARTAAWGLALYGASQVAGAIMSRSALGAVAAQAVVAEWGAGLLLITWSDPHAPVPSGGAIARRAVKGAALALGAAALVLMVALATGGATLGPSPPRLVSIALGLLVAGCASARDELLLHGVVLRVLAGVAPPFVAALACGGASAAAVALAPGGTVAQVAVAGLAGASLGILWVRDRGAWMAWGAHTAWLWATSSLLRGGLLDVRAADGRWGGGDAGVDGGLAAVAVLAVLTAFAFLRARAPNAR